MVGAIFWSPQTAIETLRNIIRPGTLAVGLITNINAGHLLLTLLGNNAPTVRHLPLQILIAAQLLLLILESAVAFTQSHIFMVVTTLYSRAMT